jgi:hypothetical protein
MTPSTTAAHTAWLVVLDIDGTTLHEDGLARVLASLGYAG